MRVGYKTIRQFSAESGYSENAIRSKIRDGVWPEGSVWAKAPDDRVLISVKGYNRWVESTMVFGQPLHRQLKSTSTMRADAVEKELSLSPPPLI